MTAARRRTATLQLPAAPDRRPAIVAPPSRDYLLDVAAAAVADGRPVAAGLLEAVCTDYVLVEAAHRQLAGELARARAQITELEGTGHLARLRALHTDAIERCQVLTAKLGTAEEMRVRALAQLEQSRRLVARLRAAWEVRAEPLARAIASVTYAGLQACLDATGAAR